MHPYVLIPLISGMFAAAGASAILTRDPRHGAHRIAALILGCAAYWSFLEVVWNSLDTPRWVPWLVRFSSLAWMPMGALLVHLFIEVTGDPRERLRRLLPWLYGAAGLSCLLYIGTPWGLAEVLETSWGWSFRFGPIFPLLCLPPALISGASLAVLWRRLYPRDASPSEHWQGYSTFAAIAVPLVTASTTDAILPLLGVHVPRLGAASLTLVGVAVAWSLRRDGFSLLVPGTLAPEILATLRDGVALLRRDGLIRSANQGLARICCASPSELLGRHISRFLPDYAMGEEPIDDLECQLVPLRGGPLPVSLSSSILRDRQGEVMGQVLSVRDLGEVVSLRSRLMMSGRLAAVGELASGIAHEINNPIAFVQSNLNQLQILWEELSKRGGNGAPKDALGDLVEDGYELIADSLSGVARVAAIVDEVRDFAQSGAGEQEAADINALLESTLRIAHPQLRYQASIRRLYGNVPPVHCNPQQLRQVFLNLVLNASNAIAEGGTISIATSVDGDHVAIRIEDDGCGIPPEVIERIFDPFFTTKQVGDGMGLGLSISYQIVQSQGGDIQVESEPGRGTCFRIRMPQAPRPPGGGARSEP